MAESQSAAWCRRFLFAEPEWLEEVDSTNDELKRRISVNQAQSGTVVAARRQTHGRGRLGRNWHSVGDAGLTFSFLWEGPISLEQAGTMPMACALAVRDFLIRLGVPSRCKWPNDIIAEAGKICGILTESVAGPDGTVRLVMGIGINVNSDPDRDAKIDQPAAWLSAYAPSASAPRTLLPKVLTCLEKRINTWTSRGYPGIKRDLEGCLWGIGKPVSVRHDGRLVKGVIEGLGDKGELRLRDEAGRSIHVVSAAALDY